MCSSILKGRLFLGLACVCIVGLFSGTAHAQSVIATIQLANSPSGVAVDPFTRKVFVAIGSGVQVINETTNTVTGSISVPTNSFVATVAVNSFASLLYVGAENGGMFIFNELTGAQVGFVNVNAASIAVNPATNVIYVSDFEGTVYAVDGRTLNIIASIPIEALENIAVNPFTNRVYAAQDLFPGKVAVIDGKTNQVIADVSGGGFLSFDVGVDPVTNRFFSADQFGTLSIFNGATNSLTATVTITGQPTGISVDPFAHKVYVSNVQTNAVNVVDESTNTLINTVAVGSSPTYSAIDPFRGLLYVGNTGQSQNFAPPAETLSVLNTK